MDIEKIIMNSGKMKGMLSSVYRFNSRFISSNRDREILGRIIKAMKIVDRRYFVDNTSYADVALPIGEGQTISQHSTVARMLFLLNLENDKVLEIGAGSGWNACLLGYLTSGMILSFDIVPELVRKAKNNLKNLNRNLEKRLEKVEFRKQNVFSKKPGEKFDKIIITAGIMSKQEEKIRKMANSLLKKEGRLVCPYKYGPIVTYSKDGRLKKEETEEEYVFVPLLE
jgi:protein-L-isoaspartate(D-aspartate) O-methyltransferase